MYYLLRSRLHLRLPMTPAFTVIYTYHELPCQLHLLRIIPSPRFNLVLVLILRLGLRLCPSGSI